MNDPTKRIQMPGQHPASLLAPAQLHSITHRLLLLPIMLVALVACSLTFTPMTPAVPTAEPSPTALLPSAISSWKRGQFGDAWDIAYPEDWAVNDAGIHEGSLVLGGYYGGHTYEVTFAYPIFERPEAMQSLDAWIDDELAFLAPEQRDAVQLVDITVAGAPAKKLLNMPEKTFDDGTARTYSERLTHACYIWRRDEKSPSVIRIKQVGGQPFDAAQAEKLLDQFLAGIR